MGSIDLRFGLATEFYRSIHQGADSRLILELRPSLFVLATFAYGWRGDVDGGRVGAGDDAGLRDVGSLEWQLLKQ